MNMFKYGVQAVFLLLIAGGCSLQTTVPASAKYMLNDTSNVKKIEASRFSEMVLRVGEMESSSLLSGRSLHYRTEEGRSYSYTKARWMESVPQQLSNLIQISITKSEIFKDVVPFRSLAKNDLIMETSLYTFTQSLHADGTSILHLSMKLRLVEQYSRKIIATTLIELEKDGVSGNAEGAVAGYNELTSELIEKINGWLEESCKK